MTRMGIATLLVVLIMCGPVRSQRAGAGLASAPAHARGRQNPFANSESARLAGRKLYLRHCAECHGPTAEGGDQAPPLRAAARAEQPGTLQWFIKNGNLRAGMPSWSGLPDQQVWQVVTYLKSLAE
jgi:mono/diheme cytochrome c family protein